MQMVEDVLAAVAAEVARGQRREEAALAERAQRQRCAAAALGHARRTLRRELSSL
eukprot:COSAG01_NODE_843_length_13172_cov_84.009791_4_plen_55_part_00